jgi:glycine cleavage system pyridoxal-binding protein P
MSGFYGVYHGPEGLKAIARDINRLASIIDKKYHDMVINN